MRLCRGLEQSPIANVTDTHSLFFCPECDLVILTELQSGMMCKHCQQKTSNHQLISFSEGFHARTSALLVAAEAWQGLDQDCSLRFAESLAIFDHVSFSWKMCQPSLYEGLIEFSWSSMRWGMTRGGQLSLPQALAPVTKGIDGSYLPTPVACIYGSNTSPNSTNKRLGLSQLVSKGLLPTPKSRDFKGSGGNMKSPDLAHMVGGSLNPEFVEELMGFKIGWTELDVLGTQWFRNKRGKHS